MTSKILDFNKRGTIFALLLMLLIINCSSIQGQTTSIDENCNCPVDSLLDLYRSEYSKSMIEACPDEADLYELNVIKQEKLFFTLLFYEWEGQTRLSLFAETVFPVPFLHCVESYALHRGDELFICQLNKGVYDKAKDSLLKGLSLSPANERKLMAWDGEPFMLDFLYVDQSWILEDRGSDKVGYWFQASQKQKKCENKRIKGQDPVGFEYQKE